MAATGEREAVVELIAFDGLSCKVQIRSRIVSTEPHCIAVLGQNPDGSPKVGPCFHDWNSVETVEMSAEEMGLLLVKDEKDALDSIKVKVWDKIKTSATRYSKAALKGKMTD